MPDRPVLVYCGRGAEEAAESWDAAGSNFAVESVATDPATALTTRDRLDCVLVVPEPDWEVSTIVGAARDRSASVPIVVVDPREAPSLSTVADLGVDHYLTVEADVDGPDVLTSVAPLVARILDRRRERSMLDSLLSNIPMSVYFKDREGRHVRVSDALLDMIGPTYVENYEGKRHHAPEDIVGKTDFDLYSPDLAAETVADDRSVMDDEEPVVDRIERSYGEEGTGTYVATSKAPWYDDDGQLVGILGVTRDISERKRYEYQLERQNERLERFATMVSHDIRNPLSVAVGRLDAARETGDPEHFDAIERALERIESLVVDVIAVTRHGESVMDPEPLDLATVARDAWAELVESDTEAGEATLTTPTEARIRADPQRLRTLLENLFHNAVEHGAEGENAVTVTVGDLPDGEGFYVADDGCGVPEDRADSVFEPGISAAASAGTGLSHVAAIADAHNWEVELVESDGGGARFEFTGVLSAHEEF